MLNRNLLLYELENINTENETIVDCNSSEWQRVKNTLTRQKWDLGYVKPEPKSTFLKRQTSQDEFKQRIYGIIRRAGIDPDDWYSNFTQIEFLGRKFNNPIHIEFATHLKIIEKKLSKKYGNNDPKIAGDVLRLSRKESLKGGRRQSSTATVASMHTYGLAMDVNYLANPYLHGKYITPAYDTEEKLELLISKIKRDLVAQNLPFVISGIKRKSAKIEKAILINIIFEHMGLLLLGKPERYPSADSYNTRLQLYIELERLNFLLIGYFNLNQDRIKQLLGQAKANTFWYGKSVQEVAVQINLEWQWFCGFIGRWKERKSIKAKGFINLDSRFVVELELDWGATYGDIMHFDMRNKCVGKVLRKAR